MKNRLLNLWPHPTRARHDETSLVHEIIFCALLALLLLGAAFVGLRHYLNQSTQVNAALQNELNALMPNPTQSTDPTQSNSSTALLEKLADWKQQSAGQLDWMATLNDAAGPSLLFIEAHQEDKQVTLSGKASSADAVAQFVATLNEQYKTGHQTKVTRLEGRNNEGAKYWLFEVALSPTIKNTAGATP